MVKANVTQDDVAILEAVSGTYHALYVINMTDGSFVEKGTAEDRIRNVVGSGGDAAASMELMCRHIVEPAYAEEMREFVDLTTLDARLREQNWLTYQFPSVHGKWCEGSFIVVSRDAAGKCREVVWAVRNIDQLKQAELASRAEIEAQNAALRQQLGIINAIAKGCSGVYYADLPANSFSELGNRYDEVGRIIGRQGNSQAALQRMCDQLIVPEQREEMRRFSDLSTLNERLRGREWVSAQFKLVRGIWIDGSFIVADRDKEGNVVHFLWVTRDINEAKDRELAYQKALEEARRAAEAASEAKTAFLFNMSHDIRTPMNAILGYTELLKKHLDDGAKADDYLTKIRSSGDFLLSLINNVLEMARIESGKSTLDEAVLDVREVLEEIANVYRELMQHKNLTFTCHCTVRTPYVYCDKVKINEIYLNLLSNAYKYTPAGGKITMELEELPGERPGWLQMRTKITDTGIGMTKEYQAVMFEEFSRERTVTETKIQGTGLGLPIVKRLVDLQGGTITVDSEPGRGTCFVVTTPHRIGTAPDKPAAAVPAAAAHGFKGKRILLAEDNELNAEIAIELLKEEGLQVDHAADGVSCVDMLQQAPPDYYSLILMDIQMPNLDGYGATQVIRQLAEPGRRDVPIVAMTANAFDEDRKNAFAAGMNDHLAKPIEVPRLHEALLKYVR